MGFAQIIKTDGTLGILYQSSLPDYTTITSFGEVDQGHPFWSCAFSIVPGKAWRDPANSVYVADAYYAKSSPCYPSTIAKCGTSTVIPPDDPEEIFGGTPVLRRFADRHVGTNCLFLNGTVRNYRTVELDSMVTGGENCVWDAE
jgi:hypothetical protein